MVAGDTVSITATETFAARAQRCDEHRVAALAVVLSCVLAVTVARRVAGGLVMSEGRMFWPTAGILSASVAFLLFQRAMLRRANRAARLLPAYTWKASAAFDICVPLALLAVAHAFSPRGAVAASASPSLLLLPMVVLLSVLRLKPTLTLALGLAGAAGYALLLARSVVMAHVPAAQYPVYIAYPLLLTLTALAGALVAREVKGHVLAAAEEATARERSDRLLAVVQQDMSIARDIQRGLLPPGPPRFDGFEIAGMSRPADLTGGDYYDWQLLPDGRLITVLADASGHGIGPALVMAVCRAYARASAALFSEPTALMCRLNELLKNDLPAGRFITLAVAVLESGGRVQLLAAGHGPSLLYRAGSGEVESFGGDGLPLGVSDDETYDPAVEFMMLEGDVLVLLTDGFYEWQRKGDGLAFGTQRLREALVASAGRNAAGVLNSIDGRVLSFAAGSPQQDDVTAVVIKRSGPRTPNLSPAIAATQR